MKQTFPFVNTEGQTAYWAGWVSGSKKVLFIWDKTLTTVRITSWDHGNETAALRVAPWIARLKWAELSEAGWDRIQDQDWG